jgi:poly-gamma-glutamate synthesis protein (capsule biosynthesis protein)
MTSRNFRKEEFRQNENAAETREATLWFGGDVNLGANSKPILDPLAEILRGGTGIVNLEGPVAASLSAGPGLKLVNAPAGLAQLREAGVRVAGIANNHAMDAGTDGDRVTAEALRKAGIEPAGRQADAAVFSVEGLRIVIAAHDLTTGVPRELAADLAAARAKGDVLVASFHVTGPESYLPRPELRKAVEIAIKADARIIVAHGTHVIGPVGRRGQSVIAWGLGNLAFACDCTKEREGLVLRVRVRADGPLLASVIPIEAGLLGEAAKLSSDPKGIFDLLAAIGSSKLERRGAEADF